MYPVEIVPLLNVVSDVSSTAMPTATPRAGSGSALPSSVLLLACVCTVFAVFVSVTSIILHLKNYRQPLLQRMVIRIMLMVPVYGIASLISLFSLNAAFFIDAIRDIYEAFVIYCFFNLLLGYLGGERSLLIRLHGRQPKRTVFPINLFKREIDVSDPYMFLFLKRGIMQYVQVKPILAFATLILKAVGKYEDGVISPKSGYMYISIIYNISICLSLYCLATFWMCISEDLAPFRPVPKFLCVKGILFFSFWQSLAISMLVSMGAIRQLGPYRDPEHISLGLTDILICFEMPIFAVAHMYAFSHTDYIKHDFVYVARMPVIYAFRDAFGMKDIIEDFKSTIRGEGINYREFEPAESAIHQGSGRDKRIRAGLRYAQGGQRKYWLPTPADASERDATFSKNISAIRARQEDEARVPLIRNQRHVENYDAYDFRDVSVDGHDGFELYFDDPAEDEEKLYQQSRHLVFGDYHYPCIDASSESARLVMWEEEERILRDQRAAYSSPLFKPNVTLGVDRTKVAGYGSIKSPMQSLSRNRSDVQDTAAIVSQGKGNIHRLSPSSWTDSGSVIDKADNYVPVADNGVRLGWTKGPRRPDGSPNPSSSSPRITDALNISTGGSTPERRNSPAGGTPSRKRFLLPPDAVDLVQSTGAIPSEIESERQKDESVLEISAPRAAQSGYRFAFEGSTGKEHRDRIQPNAAPVLLASAIGSTNGVLRAPIARASTPPPRIRFETSGNSVFSFHEENPWT